LIRINKKEMINMKTNILVGITVMLLLALPAAASDYTLGIFGNANEDDTINMQDVTYTELIILEYRDRTELADAKYDGDIDILDMTQIALIILGREKEITIVDFYDKIVTVEKPIESVIVTWRGQLELLRSLKVDKDRIAGVESYIQHEDFKIYFAEYQDKPSIGTVWSPDGEAILTLRPDIVFLFPRSRGTIDVVADVVESAGITVIRITGGTSDEKQAVKEIEMLGYLFDKRSEADELIDWQEGIMNSIKETVETIPEEDKPKVYYEAHSRYKTHESCAYIAKTGGKSIFEGKPGWVDVDGEEVVTRNPNVIIKTKADIGGFGTDDITEFEEERDELMSRLELQEVSAVKTGKVYVASNYLESWMWGSGSRGFIGQAYLAKWFNPTYFEDLDPKAIHQEYLTEFQGLDIDLDEQGVFVYHPEEHPDGN
jgi:iron complex transport system substrate-binding protein